MNVCPPWPLPCCTCSGHMSRYRLMPGSSPSIEHRFFSPEYSKSTFLASSIRRRRVNVVHALAGSRNNSDPNRRARSLARADAIGDALLKRAVPMSRLDQGRLQPLATAALVRDGDRVGFVTARTFWSVRIGAIWRCHCHVTGALQGWIRRAFDLSCIPITM